MTRRTSLLGVQKVPRNERRDKESEGFRGNKKKNTQPILDRSIVTTRGRVILGELTQRLSKY